MDKRIYSPFLSTGKYKLSIYDSTKDQTAKLIDDKRYIDETTLTHIKEPSKIKSPYSMPRAKIIKKIIKVKYIHAQKVFLKYEKMEKKKG